MIDPAAFALRTAVATDAAALAVLQERTFRDTFAAANTAADMDLHCANHYGEALQREEIEDPARLTLLCHAGDALVAFATLAWGAAPACVPAGAPGEIQRLYIDRDWHGRGLAQALMAASLRELRARGADVAWLGVWEHNARALAFYGKCGFALVGEHVFVVGSDPQRDLLMAKRLDD